MFNRLSVLQTLPFVIHQNRLEQYLWPRPMLLIGRTVGVASPRMVVKASGPKASSTSASSSFFPFSSSPSSFSSSSCLKASANHHLAACSASSATYFQIWISGWSCKILNPQDYLKFKQVLFGRDAIKVSPQLLFVLLLLKVKKV